MTQKLQGDVAVRDLRIQDSFGLDGKPLRYVRIPIVPTGTSEQLSGFKLRSGTVISTEGVVVDVTTGGGTLDFGTAETVGAGGGDANGVLAGLDVSTTGKKFGSLANAAETIGALAKETTSAGPVRKPVVMTADTELTFTCSNSAMRGFVYLPIIEPF